MADTNLKQIAQSVIPDDPEASAYRFIIVAAKRARQLQNGARSFLPTTSKKPTVMAMEEVRRSLSMRDRPSINSSPKNRLARGDYDAFKNVALGSAGHRCVQAAERRLNERLLLSRS
jgi:DNA-directed RNA polymerase subunit omega